MAKLTLLAANFFVTLFLAGVVAASISTNENSGFSENVENKRSLMRHCENFLTKSCHRVLMVTDIIKDASSCRHRLRLCCEELGQIEVQRRCQEIRRLVREKLEDEEFTGKERRVMLQNAKNLPALCRMGIGRCDIRPLFMVLD